MKRLLHILIFISLIPVGLKAQQLPHFTQYMFNDYVLNPAIAGTKDYYQVRAISRFQWVGVVDAPQTINLSINGPHSEKSMGFGGYLYNDVTGPTSKTGIYGTYAYNINIVNNIRLSMGLSLGILQNKIDGTKITLHDIDDPVLQDGVYSSWVPDASIGFYFYDENWFGGFSAFQLFSNNLKVYDEKSGLNRLKHHYYLMGGYRFDVSPQFSIEPSLFFKGTPHVTPQIDINAKVTYQEMVWLGLSYRSQDAVSILLGYIHNKRYYFGYAYEFGITEFRSYNSGTHEIMIGLRFNPIKK